MALVHPDDDEKRKKRKLREERFRASVLEIPAAPILRHYGESSQIKKTVEELDELLEEIRLGARWWRDGKTKLTARRRAAILTECADVTIMCAQLLKLWQVVWPVAPRSANALTVIRARTEAQALKEDISRHGASSDPVPSAFFMMIMAIRLGVSVSDQGAFQAEVNFKIERQLERIENERNE